MGLSLFICSFTYPLSQQLLAKALLCASCPASPGMTPRLRQSLGTMEVTGLAGSIGMGQGLPGGLWENIGGGLTVSLGELAQNNSISIVPSMLW